MLNRSNHLPNASDLGRLRQIVEAMKPSASRRQAAWRWRPGRRLPDEAKGVLLLMATLVAVCTYLLLLDRLGVPPSAMTDFPLVD